MSVLLNTVFWMFFFYGVENKILCGFCALLTDYDIVSTDFLRVTSSLLVDNTQLKNSDFNLKKENVKNATRMTNWDEY